VLSSDAKIDLNRLESIRSVESISLIIDSVTDYW